MLQRLFDKIVFAAVGLWVRASMRREWRRLRRRQRDWGVTRVTVAVPRYANEKFLWRKAFDHDPRFGVVSDKVAAKDWVAQQGIAAPMPATLWSGSDAGDIPDDVWQQPFYLKARHGWKMNIPVLTPPDAAERTAIIAQANAFMDQSHGDYAAEWAYSQVPRGLLAETAIGTESGLPEVNYFTFGGRVTQVLILWPGAIKTSARWYIADDGSLSLSDKPTTYSPIIDPRPLPQLVLDNLRVAEQIGAHFDHIRVDGYLDGDSVMFGELTVYTATGRVAVNGDKLDDPINRHWDLRRSWFLTTQQKGWRRIYAAALRRALDRRAAIG